MSRYFLATFLLLTSLLISVFSRLDFLLHWSRMQWCQYHEMYHFHQKCTHCGQRCQRRTEWIRWKSTLRHQYHLISETVYSVELRYKRSSTQVVLFLQPFFQPFHTVRVWRIQKSFSCNSVTANSSVWSSSQLPSLKNASCLSFCISRPGVTEPLLVLDSCLSHTNYVLHCLQYTA